MPQGPKDSSELKTLRINSSGKRLFPNPSLYSSKQRFPVLVLLVESCPTLCNPQTVARQASPWDSPGRNTGVGCHFLLQGIFPTEGSYLGLLYCRQTLYHLNGLYQALKASLKNSIAQKLP